MPNQDCILNRAAMLAVVACCVGSIVPVPAAEAAEPFDPGTATYEFAGDTFTLTDGKAQIMGHSGLPDSPDDKIPIGYSLAASASGELGNGDDGEAVALYRGFGANLQWVVLFGFQDDSGSFDQIAATTAYEEDSSVESLSIENGTVVLKLLVVSEADKELPHYEQKPSEPLTLRFKIEGGEFVKDS